MQYNRDDKGVMTPLPKPCVDTGMGLERIAAVLQHVHSNYEIDLFQDLIKAAARETKQKDLKNPSLNVIADHIRACAFLIVDGVIPGNEGRGYVLRRIVRRAIRHGYKLGQKQPFFHRLVADLDKAMGDAYPELRSAAKRVAEVLKQEEERFAETLEHGMGVLEGALASGEKLLDGETVFKLYDTFGFPVDLTADICRERGVSLDLAGFEAAMGQQRERARAASKFTSAAGPGLLGPQDRVPRLRHAERGGEGRRALPRRRAGRAAQGGRSRRRGARPDAVLRRIGRPGRRPRRAGRAPAAPSSVADTQKIQAEVFGHHGTLKTGALKVGDKVEAQRGRRAARERTMRNHSVTHLMHKALREVLGPHVQQKGSLVDADKTRFDFAHDKPMSDEEIRQVERGSTPRSCRTRRRARRSCRSRRRRSPAR